MKLAVISQGSKSSEMVVEAAKKYFDIVDDLRLSQIEISFSGKKAEVLYEGKPIQEYDAIYAKGSFRYGAILSVLTALLEDKCYMPITRKSFISANDKLITQMELQKHNIPMPKTYLVSNMDAAQSLLKKINYPIILKFPQGTHGKGVMFAESYSVATTLIDALSAIKQGFMIQEFIDTGGVDVRALVIGGKVVAAMKRKSAQGETRANLHQNGVAECFELDETAKNICIKAAEALGADICGVDYLEGVHGPKVLEVNISPGLQGITNCTKKDLADRIAKYLFKKAKESKTPQSSQDIIDGNEELISRLDFRAGRIVLPHLVTTKSEITEFDDIRITFGKKKINLERL